MAFDGITVAALAQEFKINLQMEDCIKLPRQKMTSSH